VTALESELAEIVGAGHVLADADTRLPYERDFTGRFGGPARCVVRPANTPEVAAVLAACTAGGAAVVPQGGNTGMVGGGVPRGGEVVVSTARLRTLGAVDAASAQVEAGAGVTLAELQAHARAAGLDCGIDFAARDAATVGGMVATDAGGARALRHGTMRAQVVGLEAVLGDGTVLERLSGLVKDNAGYDLPAMLVGSEGTLAVVARARVRLVPTQRGRAAVLFGLASLEDAVALCGALQAGAPALEAADFFLDDGLALVLDHLRCPAPFAERAPVYVIAEGAGTEDPLAQFAAVAERAPGVLAVAAADETHRRAALWRLREAHAEAINAVGVPHKLDVGVPLAALPGFAGQVRAEVERACPGARTILFGHLGDGNVHVNVLGAAPGDDGVDAAVLNLVAACGGTISAEHGVGVAKARYLGLTRTPAEIAAMRAIKTALDPHGTLNPGVLLAG
jgi:FAD/FMN-containing dehydrogenase